MKLVTRAEAGLRASRGSTALSVSIATAHYGGDGPGELDHEDCAPIWRAWQAQHMDTDQLAAGGAVDIAYNLGACQHGFVFEGRGPGVRSAANGTGAANGASYAIVYIGGAEAPLTDSAKHAFLDAAELLRAELSRGHRDWVSTSCPGDAIYEWIQAGAPRPGTPDEEDDMADHAEQLQRIEDNTKNLALIFHELDPEGQGNWERGAHRVATSVLLVEKIAAGGDGDGAPVDVDALADKVVDRVLDKLAERLRQ